MEIKFAFSANKIEMTDGGVLWEVVTSEGERIASCTSEDAAEALEQALNMAVTEWAKEDEADRVVNVE